jgi:hypothetical protein
MEKYTLAALRVVWSRAVRLERDECRREEGSMTILRILQAKTLPEMSGPRLGEIK